MTSLGDGVVARVPTWAVAAELVPRPLDGETFNAYWKRVEVSDVIVASAFFGLAERNADCANERMGSWLRREHPKKFDAYVDALGWHPRASSVTEYPLNYNAAARR